MHILIINLMFKDKSRNIKLLTKPSCLSICLDAVGKLYARHSGVTELFCFIPHQTQEQRQPTWLLLNCILQHIRCSENFWSTRITNRKRAFVCTLLEILLPIKIVFIQDIIL